MFKIVRTFCCLALCVILIFHYLPMPSAEASPGIKVLVDNREISFDVLPFMEKGRTMVPLRAIMESMNANVNWDSATARVTLKEADRVVILDIGSNVALVNQMRVTMDVSPRILNGRTLLPLRFLSENLGYDVLWEEESAAVYITTGAPLASCAPSAFPALVLPQKSGEVCGISLGDFTRQVTSLLGEPQRVDPCAYGFDWWIYNRDLLNYLQVGIKNQRVVALYAGGLEWSFGGIGPGDGQVMPARAFKLEKTIHFTYDGATFFTTQTDQELAEHPLVAGNGFTAIFYRDIHAGGQVTALFLADTETLLKRGGLNLRYQYDPRRPPDLSSPSLNTSQKIRVEAAAAQQFLDLTNSMRLRRDIIPLSWHARAADVAREHSREMLTNNYFSHISRVSGRSPFDRLSAAGLIYSYAGENIAFGYPDAFSAHASLMNSKGHREAILNKNFTHMGAGWVEQYYTQKFLTPR